MLGWETVANSGIQLGADARRTNPQMRRFVFAYRKGMALVDMRQVIFLLRKAIPVVLQIGIHGGIAYFVGIQSYKRVGVEGFALCGKHVVLKRWFGSSLIKLRKYNVPLPSVVFVLNRDSYNWVNMKTPARMNIPTVALVDTDAHPGVATYFIPGNNSSEGTRLFFFYFFLKMFRFGQLKVVSNVYSRLRLKYAVFLRKRLNLQKNMRGVFERRKVYLENCTYFDRVWAPRVGLKDSQLVSSSSALFRRWRGRNLIAKQSTLVETVVVKDNIRKGKGLRKVGVKKV